MHSIGLDTCTHIDHGLGFEGRDSGGSCRHIGTGDDSKSERVHSRALLDKHSHRCLDLGTVDKDKDDNHTHTCTVADQNVGPACSV